MITLDSKVPQIFFGIIAAVILGWAVLPFISAFSLKLVVAVLIVCTIGLILLAYYRQFFWKKLTFPHFILSAMLASSFLGSALLTVSAGPIMLFPYRILLVFLVFILFLKWMNKGITLNGQFNIPFVYLFFFVWVCYSILGLSWSRELTPAIKEVITLATSILVIFLVTILFKKEKNYLEFFTIWILMSFVVNGIGLINHFFHIHLPISRINHAYTYQKGIPTSVFVNENDYASFLGIAVFFFLSLMKNGKRIILQLVGFIGFLATIFLIFETESRANYISLFMGCAFWFIFLLKRREKFTFLYAGTLLAGAMAVMLSSKVQSGWARAKVQLDSIFSQVGQPDTSDYIRENLLQNMKVFIENTFGFGVGPGNVEYYMKNNRIYDTVTSYNPHNWWGEIFVNYGFIIFTGYILVFIYLFISLYRLWKIQIRTGNSLISEALLCGMVAFIMASISPNSFMSLNYNWIFIAFVVSYVNFHYKEIKPGGLK